MFQKFGLVEDYWKATGSPEPDKGRFDVTHDPADLYFFKVPSLRNVARTPPYFHDGSIATLPAAVRVMARVQLGKTLTEAQTGRIVTFLESLTGTLPPGFAEPPELPTAGFHPAAGKQAGCRRRLRPRPVGERLTPVARLPHWPTRAPSAGLRLPTQDVDLAGTSSRLRPGTETETRTERHPERAS